MAELFNSYTDILVFNSIVNNLDDEKFDLSKPFTFIEFLNYIKSLSNELENFKNYEIYLEQWNNLDTSKKIVLIAILKLNMLIYLKNYL